MVKQCGFTLIELLIVLAIISILLLIAVPSYQRYVIRNQRVAVQSELIHIAQKLDAYRSEHQSYAGATLPALYGSTVFPTVGTDRSIGTAPLYNLTVTISDNGAAYLLVATPTSTGSQAKDGLQVIDDQGRQCASTINSACTATNDTGDGWSHR